MRSQEEAQLKELKLAIKLWEHEFLNLNQRKPSKEDIQAASSEIKGKYKAYWDLKNKKENAANLKDAVWGESLNKSKESTSKCIRGNFQRLCSKIQKKSLHTIEKGERLKLPILNPSKKLSFNGSSNEEPCKNDESINQEIHSIDLDSEIEIIKSSIRISKSTGVLKKINSVNILLSPSVDSSKLKKNLSLDADLDCDWLERCSQSALRLPEMCMENGVDNHHLSKKSISDDKCIETKLADFTDSDSCLEFDNNKLRKDSAIDKVLDSSENNHAPPSVLRNIVSKSNCVTDCLEEDVSEIIDNSSCPSGIKDRKLIENDSASLSSEPSCFEISGKQPADSSDMTLEDSKGRKRKLTKDAVKSRHLERKIATGTLNENFVKVNIQKKKFSRGHRSVNVKKLKWQKWKNMKKSAGSGSATSSMPSACFKCGQVGHWARNCKVLSSSEQFAEEPLEDINDDCLPTLEQAAELAKKAKTNLITVDAVKSIANSQSSVKVSEQQALEDFFLEDKLENSSYLVAENISCGLVKPIFDLTPSGKISETPSEVYDALSELGYSSFRKGQASAVMRILCGLSTLVVLPTGSGKTLCYQLPAYMYSKRYSCIALVISPLVSLMEDQVTGLAKGLHAVCMHSGMTEIKKKASIEDLNSGKAQILLVSPEAVIKGLPYDIPAISFACIDEAHCLSQWSHNFRPSYLQLFKVLTQRLKVKCILGLTATANLSTIKEIASHLGLENIKESVVGSTGIPENLHLSVSRDKDKDRALIQLLSGDRFNKCSSIIIYCIRRDETERLAALIRTCLQHEVQSEEPPAKKQKTKSKKRNFLWTAEAYHAGLAPPRRRSIQKQFMSGKLRVVVATIAFGMGLDKRDVRAVIHYNMPKSFESYVQEIGRAGRDGEDAHCHLFLDSEGKDLQELRRHIYSNSTDRSVVRKLLRKVFMPCQCSSSVTDDCQGENDNAGAYSRKLSCPKHEIAFPIDDAVQELDLKEENILTLLCYLELHPKQWIEVLPPTYATCNIRCYGGPQQLKSIASKSAPVAAAIALDAKRGIKLENVSNYQFPVVKVASTMGWNASSVKRELKRLEWNDQKRKTGVIIEFTDLAFHLRALGNLSGAELDDILSFLHQKVSVTEKVEVQNLQSLCSIFTEHSFPHSWACCDEAPLENSKAIKDAINKYFDESGDLTESDQTSVLHELESCDDVDLADIRSQIREIIYTNNDQNFTGRAIARVFHGIGSPCYPAEIWGSVRKFWRSLLHIDFNLLIRLAKEELLKSR